MNSGVKLIMSPVVGGLLMAVGLLLTLGPQTTQTLLFFSVICTFGIGLIFWIGAAFLLGFLVLSLVDALIGASRGANQANSHAPADSSTLALMGYLRRSMEAGASLSQISPKLQHHGWSEAEIQAAYQRVVGDSPPNSDFLDPV